MRSFLLIMSIVLGSQITSAQYKARDLTLLRSDSTLSVAVGSHALLSYYTVVKNPPKSVDPAYGRSGFIHPLSTLAGTVLTRIQPSDHYHHYGLWNPWTRVEYRGNVYDLWNLGDKQGTVRHKQFLNQKAKGNQAGFIASLEHVAYKPEGGEIILLNEHWEIESKLLDDKRYQLNLISTLINPNENAVTLKAYRYAGLGLRATEKWNNENSLIKTSSGKDRLNADGSLERWFFVQGDVDGEQAGILFLSSPQNFNHPEPIRVWPASENDVFVNFSPTKTKDWVLQPQKENRLYYRLIVFDGTITKEEAEEYWQSFAHQNK